MRPNANVRMQVRGDCTSPGVATPVHRWDWPHLENEALEFLQIEIHPLYAYTIDTTGAYKMYISHNPT